MLNLKVKGEAFRGCIDDAFVLSIDKILMHMNAMQLAENKLGFPEIICNRESIQ